MYINVNVENWVVKVKGRINLENNSKIICDVFTNTLLFVFFKDSSALSLHKLIYPSMANITLRLGIFEELMIIFS